MITLFGLGWPELLLIIAIILLLFGAGRIKTIIKSLGEGVREFRKAMREIEEVDKEKK